MKSYDFQDGDNGSAGAPASEPRLSKGSVTSQTLVTSKANGINNPSFTKGSVENISKIKDEKNNPSQHVEEEEEDPWNIVANIDTGPKWKDLSNGDRCKRVAINVAKVTTVLILLYFFICSLDLLSSAFKLIAGKSTSALLENELIKQPVVGLMVGILLTVLLQSSSTSTSIIVAMVSANMLSVEEATPMIMGANVGTSVTNTIVSLTQVGNKNEFRRAFAGATVHDMFNWLSVFVQLPLEVATGFLEKLAELIVEPLASSSGADVVLLKYITEPFTDLIIQLNSDVLTCWGINQWQNVTTLIMEYCDEIEHNVTTTLMPPTTAFVSTTDLPTTDFGNVSTTSAPVNLGMCSDDNVPSVYGIPDSCHFLFYNTDMTDQQVGLILLAISLTILCTALVVIVKILNSLLKGSIAVVIRKTLNADIPYMPWLTGYIAIVIGAFMTFIVQSSSIFTSTLTPLIGIGIITIERAYPLTLGSNIGTTTTALLASLAGSGEGLYNAIQIALVHLFFNIFGILIFYPIPFMRFPIPMSKYLGEIVADYRWFAIIYLIGMFLVLPVFIFSLSLGGTVVLWSVLIPLIVFFIIIAIINLIQNKKKEILPSKLQTWDWVPEPLRSLRPYDNFMISLPCCKSCKKAAEASRDLDSVKVDSSAFSSRANSIKKEGIDNQTVNVDL